MRTEVPECKRCCFCMPLRYGLITWGYLRLATSMLYFTGMSIIFYRLLARERAYSNESIVSIVILGFVLVLTMTDLVLNTVFIVGGYMKNLKLLRAYYIYSFVLCVLTSLLSMASVIYTLIIFNLAENLHILLVVLVVGDIATWLALVFVQIYVLLLVRSEIIKLRSNCEFRFVNNAAEAECTMNICEEQMVYGEEAEEGSKKEEITYER